MGENTKMPWDDKLILILVIIIAFYVLWFCWGAVPAKSQRFLRPNEQQEVISKLKARNLPLSTRVEISEDGHRYEWEGKWVKL